MANESEYASSLRRALPNLITKLEPKMATDIYIYIYIYACVDTCTYIVYIFSCADSQLAVGFRGCARRRKSEIRHFKRFS